jgi:hypothetical protein
MSWYPPLPPPGGFPPPALGMPFGFLPPPSAMYPPPPPPMPMPMTSQPLLPMAAAFAPFPAAAPAAPSTAGSAGKRPFDSSSCDPKDTKFPRNDFSSRGDRGGSSRGGRGGIRGGRGGSSTSSKDAALFEKYLAPAAPAGGHLKTVTAMYSSATGEMVPIASSTSAAAASSTAAAVSATPAAPVYCQRFMENHCHLRSCDAPREEGEGSEDDDEEVDDAPDAGAPPKKKLPRRCEFVHDIEFRRSYLARAHYTHTKFTQSHLHEGDSSNASSDHRSTNRPNRHSLTTPPVLDPQASSGTDGRLAGLKPPVAESALLRKLLSSETQLESSRALQAIRYMVSQQCFQAQREAQKAKQQQLEAEYQAQRTQPAVVIEEDVAPAATAAASATAVNVGAAAAAST